MNGFSLVEVLIGLTLVTLAIAATVTIVFGSQSVIIDRDNTITAQLLSKEGIVATNAIIKNDWAAVADGSYGLTWNGTAWQLAGAQDIQSIFTRVITISSTALSDERQVKSTVSWASSPLRPAKKVELVTYISNWADVLASGGDTGGGGTSGDWTNPVSLGSANVGAGNSATDVDAVGNVVYISTESSTKSKPDIHAYNITNPATPTLLSEIDVDAYSLQSIDGSSSYLFSSATGVLPDLKIINNTNPASLSLAAEYNLITFVDATKIFRDINTIFLGVKQTSFSGEFFALNTTVPTSPSEFDNFEINADVNGIYELNGTAYLATSHDSREMYVLNVSNPSNITQVGVYNNTGSTDGTSVFAVSPSRVFLGVGSTMYILNATNPASITTLGSFNAGGAVNDMYIAGNLAFLATSNSNSELQIVNISNVASPTLVSSLNFPQVATGIDYQNNMVFVSVRSNDGLRIITSAP